MMYTLEYLRSQKMNDVSAFINGKYVTARPESFTFKYRLKAAWAVLTGKADAFTWPEGQ